MIACMTDYSTYKGRQILRRSDKRSIILFETRECLKNALLHTQKNTRECLTLLFFLWQTSLTLNYKKNNYELHKQNTPINYHI